MNDAAKFCPKCGNPCSDQNERNDENNTYEIINPNNDVYTPEVLTNRIFCPNCHSTNLQAIIENKFESSGGGYDVGAGCLGAMCLGWPGLLCGLLGSKQEIKSKNQTYWLCLNCGWKFKSQFDLAMEQRQNEAEEEEAWRERKRSRRNTLLTWLIAILIAILIFGSIIMFLNATN